MNKNIKRIVALALVLGTVSAVAPATNLNLLVTKAYATDDNTHDTLDSLKVKKSNGDNLQLYDDDDYGSGDKVDDDEVKEDVDYYVKTSSKTINFDIDGPSNSYVKVFKGTSSSTKGKSITSDIELSSGTNTIVVKVYSKKPESGVRYDDKDNVTSVYKIKVKYTGSDTTTTEDSADNYDDIYLDSLSVDGKDISLSKSKVVYTYNVPSNSDEVTIKAVPDNDDYIVRVDGSKVYEDDKYKKDISLKTGLNEITIKIEDEDNDEERIYTLKITRGTTTSTNGNVIASTTPDTVIKTEVAVIKSNVNQWAKENGVWKYYDALGNKVTNNWFYDRNYGKNYYLQSDGTMATGWLPLNGKWYYLGTDGGMKTGWIIDGGKYYYLYSDGSMALNTSIGSYRLGSSGAWIGR